MLTEESVNRLRKFIEDYGRELQESGLGGPGNSVNPLVHYQSPPAAELTAPGTEGAILHGPPAVASDGRILDHSETQYSAANRPSPVGQLPTGNSPVSPLNDRYSPETLSKLEQRYSGQTGEYTPASLTDSSSVNPIEGEHVQSFNPPGLEDHRGVSDTGGIPYGTEHYYQSRDAANLESTLNRQRYEAERVTGEETPDEEGGGTLTKVLDLLMRANHTIAGGFRGIQEGFQEDDPNAGFLENVTKYVTDAPEVIGNFAEGAWEGATGERKETFSDVLEAAGVENNVARGVGGFIFDVGLDPTTYVGAGVIKGASQAAAKSAAARAAASTMRNPVTREAAENTVMNRLIAEAGEKNLQRLGPKGAGTARVEIPSRKVINELVDKEVGFQAREAASLAEEAITTAGKGAVEFKVGGRTVIRSERVYSGVAKLTGRARELPTVKAFMARVSPKAEYGDAWQMIRDQENIGLGQLFDTTREFRDMTRHLNKDQATAISRHIEGTEILTDPELIKVSDYVQSQFKALWDAEQAVGLHAKDAVPRDNYLYHFYRKGQEQVRDYKAKKHNRRVDFTQQRQFPTLEEAIKDGMNPFTDIREIYSARMAKHFDEMTHHTIMTDLMENYGLLLNKKTTRRAQVQNERIMATAKELDLPMKPLEYVVGGRKGDPDAVYRAVFPEPIADVFKTLLDIRAEPKGADTLLRHADKVHQNLKFWLTVANPGHHIRNFYGNVFMAYQDGVRNPKRYLDALVGVRGMNAKIGSEAYQRAGRTRVRIANGTSDLNEISQLYRSTGTKSGFTDIELGDKVTSKAGRIIRQISTEREDVARMGHFIDALKKEAKSQRKNWADMTFAQKREFAMSASRRVQKHQLDYGDLTRFEKSTARRLMMFYTFARKNTVLQLEMLATRPGTVVRVPQVNNAIEEVLGINPADEGEAFAQRIPEWIRDMNAPQIGDGTNFVSRLFGKDEQGNVTEDPIYGNALLPTSDLGRIQGPADTFRQIISELRPELKIPIELAMDRQAFSGAPAKDTPQTITQMTPITNLLAKTGGAIAERLPNESVWDAIKRGVGTDWTSYLSGISVQRADPNRQQSELRRRQQIVQDVLREFRQDAEETQMEEARLRAGG